MVNTDPYVQNPIYEIIGVNVDDSSKEIEFYVSEYNEAQKSIPKVIDGYSIYVFKDSIG